MKWALYAVGMILLFVMLAFGMTLVSQGQEATSEETLNDPGYQHAATATDVLFGSVQGVPWVLGIIAAILVLAYLARRYY